MKLIKRWSPVVLVLGCAWGIAVLAQAPAIQRTVVKKGDVSVPGREAVITRVEIAPMGSAGRHTHPGDELTYVTEGEGEILIEGQPPLKVKAGDGFVVKGGLKHDAHNTAAQPMKLIAIYVVDKDKPLATPAP
ncbi:MAG: cupin domain-containing protein [Terriglobia bacterium]|nr:MAG: cupin domain-containing protein [Terriglobia bacterium]